MRIDGKTIALLHRPTHIIAALVAQALVSAILTPWAAPSSDFYSGATWAIGAGFVVHVVVRVALWKWSFRGGSTAMSNTTGEAERPSRKGAGGTLFRSVLLAFVAAMVIAFVCALALDTGWIGATAAIFVCVLLQQLVFATSAYQLQRSDAAASQRAQVVTKLILLSLFALYFSIAVPALFRQIATRVVVPYESRDLLFALPAVIVAITGIVRTISRSRG
jgi:hypothetical protein